MDEEPFLTLHLLAYLKPIEVSSQIVTFMVIFLSTQSA